MAFTAPTFPLTCNIWRPGNATWNPPDLSPLCNLALGKRAGLDVPIEFYGSTPRGLMWLLLPIGTDIRDSKASAGEDTVEVPAGSQRYYLVKWVDDAGGGFANEHRFAMIDALTGWPTPFPKCVGPYPPPPVAPLNNIRDTLGTFPTSLTSVLWTGTQNGHVLVIFVIGSSAVSCKLAGVNPVTGATVMVGGGTPFILNGFFLPSVIGANSAAISITGAPPSVTVYYNVYEIMPAVTTAQSNAWHSGAGPLGDTPPTWSGGGSPIFAAPVEMANSTDPGTIAWNAGYTTIFEGVVVSPNPIMRVAVAAKNAPGVTPAAWTVTPASGWSQAGAGTLLFG